MTTFEDGPAKGQTLSLARAPLFLRVVHDNAGTSQHGWDALDQPEDSPRERESIHVYLLAHKPGHVHINRGRKGSGWYAIASYRLYTQQPDDATMRDSGRWSVWVHDQNPQALAGALPDYGSAEQVQRSQTIREVARVMSASQTSPAEGWQGGPGRTAHYFRPAMVKSVCKRETKTTAFLTEKPEGIPCSLCETRKDLPSMDEDDPRQGRLL